jgi:hypothetical protein
MRSQPGHAVLCGFTQELVLPLVGEEVTIVRTHLHFVLPLEPGNWLTVYTYEVSLFRKSICTV